MRIDRREHAAGCIVGELVDVSTGELLLDLAPGRVVFIADRVAPAVDHGGKPADRIVMIGYLVPTRIGFAEPVTDFIVGPSRNGSLWISKEGHVAIVVILIRHSLAVRPDLFGNSSEQVVDLLR